MKSRIRTVLSYILLGSMLCSCSSSGMSETEPASETETESVAATVITEDNGRSTEIPQATESNLFLASNVIEDACVYSPIDVGENRWYQIDSQILNDSYWGFSSNYMPDSNGYIYLVVYGEMSPYIDVYSIDDSSYAGTIDLFGVENIYDSYGVDVSTFEIDGTEYVQICRYFYDEVTFDLDHIENNIYSIDLNTFTLGDEICLLDADRIIVSAYKTMHGTCLVTYTLDDDTSYELYFYNDGEVTIIDINAFFINDVATLDNGDIVIIYEDDEYNLHTVGYSADGTQEVQLPGYINENYTYYNVCGRLIAIDGSGVYLIQDEEPLCMYTYGQSVGDAFSAYNAVPLTLSDTAMTFMSEEYDGRLKPVLTKLTLCDFPYEDRSEIVVGIPRESSEVVLKTISEFNETNDEYYAVPLVISDSGFNPVIDRNEVEGRIAEIQQNISLGESFDDAYLSQLIEECAFSMELKEYVSGPNAPDVLATEGLWAQLNDTGIMMDMSFVYDDLSDEDYFTNIFDATSRVGNRFVPIFYYVSGVMDLVSDDSDENVANSSISYTGYQNLINNRWDGIDPVAFYCTDEQYAEELISNQYDLFMDRENGEIHFCDNSNFDIMFFYYSFEVQTEYNDSFYPENAFYNKFYSVVDYLSLDVVDNNYTFYALPSNDNRTISAETVLSMGIPNSANEINGAEEFVLFSLSPEAQILCGNDIWGMPVNRTAFNSLINDSSDWEDPGEREAFINMIETISNIYVVDAEVRLACYGPLSELSSNNYQGDYSAESVSEEIETNMNYFISMDF